VTRPGINVDRMRRYGQRTVRAARDTARRQAATATKARWARLAARAFVARQEMHLVPTPSSAAVDLPVDRLGQFTRRDREHPWTAHVREGVARIPYVQDHHQHVHLGPPSPEDTATLLGHAVENAAALAEQDDRG
jgi:hypothetical protein